MSRRSKAWRVGWALLLSFSSGCGGKSQIQGGGQEPSGAGAANGGTSGQSGGPGVAGAASGGESSRGCPLAQPAQGDRCDLPFGTTCSYAIDKCSSINFECIHGYWFKAPQSDGAAFDCNSFSPPNAPKDGDPCECFGFLDCSYDDCAARGKIHAVCDNTVWHVKESTCKSQPCGPGGLTCAPGTVCVMQGGPIGQFECAKNPCAPEPISCDCAAQLCEVGQCTIDSGAVACVCPTC